MLVPVGPASMHHLDRQHHLTLLARMTPLDAHVEVNTNWPFRKMFGVVDTLTLVGGSTRFCWDADAKLIVIKRKIPGSLGVRLAVVLPSTANTELMTPAGWSVTQALTSQSPA